jgi:hypothetical protein
MTVVMLASEVTNFGLTVPGKLKFEGSLFPEVKTVIQ